LLAGINAASLAIAHGTPIVVNVVNDKLSVSGGLADTTGYAPMIFVEDDEDGDPFGEANLPGFGPSIIWQLPGFEIHGMAENSGLFLQALSRPVATVLPVEHRVLWYWAPQSQLVVAPPDENPFNIRKSTSQNITLSPTDPMAPPQLQIAVPLASEMGFHNHLVAYALSNAEPAPAGAYGFFARLTSNQYAPSDPFLVVFNNEVFDYVQMPVAALAINAAAFLPGDFNHDDRVNSADYIVWRKSIGTSPEYALWRGNFGAVVAGSASGLADTSSGEAALVPEPAAALLAFAAVLGLMSVRACRYRAGPVMKSRQSR
jgi:hypothetical protein